MLPKLNMLLLNIADLLSNDFLEDCIHYYIEFMKYTESVSVIYYIRNHHHFK